MTSETKTTIEPADILAVELECSVCGTRLSRPVNEYRGEPSGCQNCGAHWGHLTTEFKYLANLVMILRLLSERMAQKDGFPFKVRFEIASPTRREQS